jgi:hypothetical protein
MIYRMIGRTIMFSQVGFPTINCHPRPDPVPMFICYPRPVCDLSHRPRSVPPASVCAMGFHPRHRQQFAQLVAIRAISWHRPISRDLSGDSQENKTKYIIAMATNSDEKRLKLKE